eukprot:gene8355-17213_t
MDRGNASEECFQILLGIRDSCASAVTILNESLDYDKLETGIMVLDKTIFSAWKFLQEAVSSFEHQVALSLGIKMPAIIIENNQLQLQYQHHTNSAEINSVEDQVEDAKFLKKSSNVAFIDYKQNNRDSVLLTRIIGCSELLERLQKSWTMSYTKLILDDDVLGLKRETIQRAIMCNPQTFQAISETFT